MVGIALRYDVSFSLIVPIFPLKVHQPLVCAYKALFIVLFIKALFTEGRNALFNGVTGVFLQGNALNLHGNAP